MPTYTAIRPQRFAFSGLVYPSGPARRPQYRQASPLRRAKLEAKGLVASLVELVQSEKLPVAAVSLGEQIRLDNGIKEAVNLIEATFGMIT